MEQAVALREIHHSRSILETVGADARDVVERFIHDVFAERFAARLDSFLPNLVASRDAAGRISAAAGYRSAAAGRLFLEQYLDRPIEEIVCDNYGEAIARSKIVEVGNLATTGGRCAVSLVASLIPHLMSQGFRWVVFTGNDAVRNLFQRLHLFPFAICTADAASLGDAKGAWGSYYDHHPIVMAGRLYDGAATITLPVRGA
jgi:hypothetical protein